MSISLFSRLHRQFGPRRTDEDRRAMLKATLAASAGLLLSGPVAMARGRVFGAPKRIVVIGAGFSGLACAHELTAAGYDVTVIEARNRVGGRVLSFGDFVPGKNVEGGGELIGSNHPAWVSYAEKFGLEFIDVTEPEDAEFPIVLGGQRLTAKEAEELYEQVDAALAVMNADAASIDADAPWSSPNAAELDKRTVQQWIAAQEVSALCKMGMAAMLTADNGVATSAQSYLGLLTSVKGGGLEKYWTDSEVLRCKGGNQQLAIKLAAGLKDRVVLGLSVRSIRASGSDVKVECNDGRTLTCDDVVLAVPPPTWKRIEIQPGLPASLNPQMSINVKYLSHVKKKFWLDHKLAADSLTDGEMSMTWDGTDNQGDEGAACMVAFSGGPGAELARSRDAEKRKATYSALIESMYPGYGENFVAARFMDWPAEQWTGAGYSFPAPGQVTTMGPQLAAAHCGGKLHLAGEHCCYKFVGYMEGALSSGIAVAKRLVARDGIVK